MRKGNIQVRNEELRAMDVILRSHMTASTTARQEMDKYPSLSEAEGMGTLPSLDIAEEFMRVVLELTKDETPLVRKDTQEQLYPEPAEQDPKPQPVPNPTFGKFIEIDANGNDVMDGDVPKVAFDPKALEWEAKVAVL